MDTKLFVRKQSGGMFQVVDKTQCLGDIFYVSSTTTGATDSTGYGQNPDTPFATLAYALTQCTANAYDTIYVLPRHAETITGAGGLTFDMAGTSVIGLANSWADQPAFLMDGANTVTALVTAANQTIEGLTFNAGHADIVTGIHITADGTTIRHCRFGENVATENFLTCILVGTADNDADDCTVDACQFFQIDAASLHAVWMAKNQDNLTITNNFAVGTYASGEAVFEAPNTEIGLQMLIANNVINNAINAGATVGIDFGAANTGAVVNNLIGHQDTAGETPVLAVGCTVAENYASGVLGTKSGYIYPAIDA